MQVKEQALIELENQLNEIKFNGIPIGGLTASALYIELFLGNGDWSFKSRLKDRLLRLKLKSRLPWNIKKNKIQESRAQNVKGQALITFSSARRHIFNMGYVYWQNLQESDSICLLLDKSAKNSFADQDNPTTVVAGNLMDYSFSEWNNRYNAIVKQVRKVLFHFVSENEIPSYVVFRITNYIIGQTQRLMAFENYLLEVKPKYILVEYDRFHITSPLVLAARNTNTPTFTMVHGAINNQIGYLPILANRLFCWGKGQKAQLEKFIGASSDEASKIVATGAPQMSYQPQFDQADVKVKLGIESDKQVVLLATNSVRLELRHQLIDLFGKALNGNGEIQGVVRIHPSEDPEFYKPYMTRYSNVVFDLDHKLSYEESFSIADLVCIYNSAYGLDAILNEIPVMVIDVDSEGLGQSADLVQTGQFPLIKTETELSEKVKTYFNDEQYSQEFAEKVKTYANFYCTAFGKRAAGNILNAINTYLSESSD